MKLLRPVLAILLILMEFLSGYGQTGNNISTNKQLVEKLFDEVINKRNLSVLEQVYVKDVIDHSAFPDQKPGLEGIKNAINGLFESYPDIHVDIQEMIAEKEFVVTRDLWSATEKGTGKKKSGWVIHIIKIKSGKVTEEWSKGWEWLSP
jgi:predicted ester cyclase